MRKLLTVRGEQTKSDAPFVLADFRLSPGKFSCRPIVIGDLAEAVRRIDGDRQTIENLLELIVLAGEFFARVRQIGHIDGEAPRLDKLPVSKLPA